MNSPSKSPANNIHSQINQLNEQAWQTRNEDYIQALAISTQAKQLATTLSPPSGFSVAQNNLIEAYIAFRRNEYQNALLLTHNALDIFQINNSSTWLVRAYGLLGIIYSEIGHKTESSNYLLLQLDLAKQIDSKVDEALALHDIGINLGNKKDFVHAHELLSEARHIFASINDSFYEVSTLFNIGWLYLGQKKYPQAKTKFECALQKATKYGNNISISLSQLGLGSVLIKTNQFEQGERYLQEALQARNTISKYIVQAACCELSELYLAQKKPEQAMPMLIETLAFSKKSGNQEFQYTCHELLAKTYKQQGNLQQALYHYEQFHKLKVAFSNHLSLEKVNGLLIGHRAEKKRQEEESRKLKAKELEENVAQRTHELREALAREKSLATQLEVALQKEAELAQLKTHIINVVSHEFRTPLSVINNASTLLAEYGEQMSPEKRQQNCERIHDQIFFLTDLLQDIFFINTNQEARVQYSPIQITFSKLCQIIKQEKEKILTNKLSFSLNFSGKEDRMLLIDIAVLQRIIKILLSNIIKYAPVEPIVTINVKLNSTTVKIEISDNGIGIPIDENVKIFDLFHRGSNIVTERGMGLGLYIAKNLAEGVGGKIWAESAGINQGSTFTFCMPI